MLPSSRSLSMCYAELLASHKNQLPVLSLCRTLDTAFKTLVSMGCAVRNAIARQHVYSDNRPPQMTPSLWSKPPGCQAVTWQTQAQVSTVTSSYSGLVGRLNREGNICYCECMYGIRPVSAHP